jgi:hypothetical protein
MVIAAASRGGLFLLHVPESSPQGRGADTEFTADRRLVSVVAPHRVANCQRLLLPKRTATLAGYRLIELRQHLPQPVTIQAAPLAMFTTRRSMKFCSSRTLPGQG